MDFDKLEHELNGMVAADNLYWERNDAKFRAAKQNVSYEQFEQIVKGSHLKPLGKKDSLDFHGNSKTTFNQKCSKNASDNVFRAVPRAKNESEVTVQLQCSKKDSQKSNQKVATLEVINSTLRTLLEEVQNLPKENLKEGTEKVLQTIQILIGRPRFDLEWCFASGEDKQLAQKLFRVLEEQINKLPEDEKMTTSLRIFASKVI